MTRRLVAVLLGALVMAGCSAEADPTPEPSSVTTGPSPEPTTLPSRPAVSAPEPPANMSRSDAEGAKAAAEYFLALYSYSYRTGDLAEWETISADDCVFCNSVIENVSELHNAGGYQIGGDIEVLSVEAIRTADKSALVRVDAEIREARSTQVSGNGATHESNGGEAQVILALEASEEGWIVREAQAEE